MYQISKEVHGALLNYLASKPYAEVHQLVGYLANLQPIEGVVENKPEENKEE